MCKGGFALLVASNQHSVVFKPGSPYNSAQHAVLSNSLLSVCFAIQNILNLCSFEFIDAVLPLMSAACCHVHGVRKCV